MKRRLFARLLAVVLAAESVFQCVGTLPVHAAGEIPIDESHFPDAEFRKIMSQKYDRDRDGSKFFLVKGKVDKNANGQVQTQYTGFPFGCNPHHWAKLTMEYSLFVPLAQSMKGSCRRQYPG